MRRLFLVRHAKAEHAVGRDDYERALTDRGREDARRVAGALAARDMMPDLLIHSGALRTKQTAEIFAGEWPRRVELEEEPGLYDATPGMLYARARALPDSHARIGLVGHNPGIGELAVSLAGVGRLFGTPPHGGQISHLRCGRARLFRCRPGTTSSARPRCSRSS